MINTEPIRVSSHTDHNNKETVSISEYGQTINFERHGRRIIIDTINATRIEVQPKLLRQLVNHLNTLLENVEYCQRQEDEHRLHEQRIRTIMMHEPKGK